MDWSKKAIITINLMSSTYKVVSSLVIAVLTAAFGKDQLWVKYMSGIVNLTQPFIIGLFNFVLIYFISCFCKDDRYKTRREELINYVNLSPGDLENVLEGKKKHDDGPEPAPVRAKTCWYFWASLLNFVTSAAKIVGPLVTGIWMLVLPSSSTQLSAAVAVLNATYPFLISITTRILEVIAVCWCDGEAALNNAIADIRNQDFDAEIWLETLFKLQCPSCGKNSVDASNATSGEVVLWAQYPRRFNQQRSEANDVGQASNASTTTSNPLTLV